MQRPRKNKKSLFFGFITIALFSLTLVSGLILSSSSILAVGPLITDTVVDEINITIPVSCSLTGVGMNTHNATINNGTYASDIGTTTLKASCNDNNGFAIYAAGYTGDEVGGTNSTKLVGANNIGNIVTGTETSGATSKWAMKLATNSEATYPISILSDTNGSYSNYHIVPEEFAKVAQRQSSTDIGTSAIGSILTTTYQTYISPTQSSGTYTGKVIYVLVHPYTHNAPVACNPNATTISEVKCMQDFASVSDTNRTAILNSMTEGTQYTIKDKRDGKTYTIAKLADGNVWMTQNLDLDIDSNTTYTNLDTDIGYNTTTGQYDTAAWSPIRSTYSATATQTHEWCQGGTWNSEYDSCENNNSPESYDPGNLYWNATTSNRDDWNAYSNSCTSSTNPPTCDQSLNPLSTYTSSTGTSQYHLGNYYNWAAALATNDGSVYGDRVWNELVEQSICPAGWTLPRVGDGEDSFQALWEEYGYDEDNSNLTNASALWSSPLYFAASGSFGGALGNVGSGFFWSPVAGSSSLPHVPAVETAWNASFLVDFGGSSSGSYRSFGLSVRCIARPVANSVSGLIGVEIPK